MMDEHFDSKTELASGLTVETDDETKTVRVLLRGKEALHITEEESLQLAALLCEAFLSVTAG